MKSIVESLKMFLYIFLQLINLMVAIALKFENITYDIFPINSGIIAAFGHFNSDEFTDVFSLQQGGRKLQIFLGNEIGQPFQSHVNCSFGNEIITNVVPADFNGDSLMDVLITTSKDQESDVRDIKILWGGDGGIDCKSSSLLKIVNQPLIVDFNGDMIPDIIGEKQSGEMHVWIASKGKHFSKGSLLNMTKFGNPHSSGLVDLNNDLIGDIIITGEDKIELWINTGKEFVKNDTIPYSPSSKKRFQSTFVDLNLDANLDHIMPVCYDDACNSPAILLWDGKQWNVLFDDFKHDNTTWSFKLPKGPTHDMAASLPVTLRAGDIDMDGYPDFITILQSRSNDSNVRPIIIKNNPCSNCSHCIFDRCLEIIWNIPGLQDIPNIEIAAFFDIFEDGVLDILASSYDHEWKIHAFKNSEILDSCFMKVLVLSGLCDNCSLRQMPYGVNLPGPIVRYNMTKPDGKPLVSSAVQISQTAYFSLHLPYSVFGLGQTPNFVDALTVAIPAKFDKSVHKREWIQIIPNSQIVVIPHPPDEEKKWVKKLFVTPSHYVLLTCIALIGTCTFISMIVALLHWRERKEDKKEKMQDAYRFHFDAM